MKVLIDTHIALWALMDDPKMPKTAKQILMDENNDIYYSTASVWEVAIKHCIRPDDMIVDARLFETSYISDFGYKLRSQRRSYAFHCHDNGIFRQSGSSFIHKRTQLLNGL